ncbi:MAG TPA: hypothetical protein VGK58_19355 [Lacipirellulaceae bacterium]
MNTTLARYEVGHDRHGLDGGFSRKAEAFQWALDFVEQLTKEGEQADGCVHVYDRMARRGAVCHWTVRGGAIVGTGQRLT